MYRTDGEDGAAGGRARALPHAAAFLAALLLAAAGAALAPVSAAGPGLAIDADPTGNGATNIGEIDSCVAVATGDEFQVDIVIDAVQELLAWEVYFQFDPTVVIVTGRDVQLFQAANPGSSPYDLSDRLPNDGGAYRLTVADISDPPTPDSGSGVLARVTLQAVGPGTATLTIGKQDIDGDSRPDRGPFLRDVDADPIGDEDGDSLFDGTVGDARVAVDAACPPGTGAGRPVATADSGGGGLPSLYLLAPGIAAAVAVAGGAGTLVLLARRRTRPGHLSE